MRGATPPASTYPGFSLPQAEFSRQFNVGRNLRDKLVRTGEIDSAVIGDRERHIIVDSYYAHVARRLAGTERDPVEKQRAIESYQLSLQRSKGARATALARSGWGPDHGKKGGSKHVANRGAPPARKASPPAAEAPKSKSGKARSSRKESVTTM